VAPKPRGLAKERKAKEKKEKEGKKKRTKKRVWGYIYGT
jgi:hypothetical protein